jgi:hypothetical protein
MKQTFVLLLSILFLTACNKKSGCTHSTATNYDPTAETDCGCCQYPTSMTLHIIGQVDNNPFVLATPYSNFGGRNMNIQNLRFFLSKVTLINATGETPVLDIAEVNFYKHQAMQSTAPDGEPVTLNNITPGHYTGIRFSIGVDSATNATTPNDHISSLSPLHDGANYWEHWRSYIFAKVEGQVDTGTIPPVYSLIFTYHTAKNALYRTKTINKTFDIIAGQSNRLDLRLDIRKLLQNVDLVNESYAETPNPTDPVSIAQYNLSVKIANNLIGAIEAM